MLLFLELIFVVKILRVKAHIQISENSGTRQFSSVFCIFAVV